MRVGKSKRIRESRCTSCGKQLTGAMVVDDRTRTPKPGDVSVCMWCGHIMAFDAELALRDLTDDEVRKVAGDKRILAIQKARAGP